MYIVLTLIKVLASQEANDFYKAMDWGRCASMSICSLTTTKHCWAWRFTGGKSKHSKHNEHCENALEHYNTILELTELLTYCRVQSNIQRQSWNSLNCHVQYPSKLHGTKSTRVLSLRTTLLFKSTIFKEVSYAHRGCIW